MFVVHISLIIYKVVYRRIYGVVRYVILQIVRSMSVKEF